MVYIKMQFIIYSFMIYIKKIYVFGKLIENKLYSHSVMKQIQRLENIKKNDTFSDGNLHEVSIKRES